MDPYGFIGKVQAFTGKNKSPRNLAEELFEGLIKIENRRCKKKLADILVDKFVNSRSFQGATDGITKLESLSIWKPHYSDKILKAEKENGQINGAWGVSERVKKLVEKKL